VAISDNITRKMDEVEQEIEAREQDPQAPTPHTDELHAKALNAILGGSGSPQWEDYMNLFATNAQELARLIPTDGTTQPDREQARAYLVANGMCFLGTTTGLIDNVTTDLD